MFTSRATQLLRTTPLLRTLPRISNALPRAPLRRMTTAAPLRPHRPPPSHTSHLHNSTTARAELAAQKRRQVVLIAGMTLSMSALWFFATSIEIKTETFKKVSDGEDAGHGLVDSGTSSVPPFPKKINHENLDYSLIGLGVRKVSVLGVGVKVYVVGLYIAADDLGLLKEKLLDIVNRDARTAAERRDLLSKTLLDAESGELAWKYLLGHVKVRSCLRIVPTRFTTYEHLRDGWVRSIERRSSEYKDDDRFSAALTAFKQAFAQKKSVAKKTILLTRDANGRLGCYYDPSGRNDGKVGGDTDEEKLETLGRVEDRRLSTVMWLYYLAGEKVPSEPARKSIVDGLVALLGSKA